MAASDASETRRLYLAGNWIDPVDPLDVTNPANGQLIGRIGTVGRDVVAQALADAHAAWPAWRALSGKQRGGYLLEIAAGIQSRADEIARTITLENGKPLPQSKGEVG